MILDIIGLAVISSNSELAIFSNVKRFVYIL